MIRLTGPSVAIIGAGFAGLIAAIGLARTGADVTFFERASGAGGVRRTNNYPRGRVRHPEIPIFLVLRAQSRLVAQVRNPARDTALHRRHGRPIRYPRSESFRESGPNTSPAITLARRRRLLWGPNGHHPVQSLRATRVGDSNATAVNAFSSARDSAPSCAWSDRSVAIVLPSRPTAAKDRAYQSLGAEVSDDNLVKFQQVRWQGKCFGLISLHVSFCKPVTSHGSYLRLYPSKILMARSCHS